MCCDRKIRGSNGVHHTDPHPFTLQDLGGEGGEKEKAERRIAKLESKRGTSFAIRLFWHVLRYPNKL